MFVIRPMTIIALSIALASAFIYRLHDVIIQLPQGNETPLLIFPFTVIFPSLLILIMLKMKPTSSREGLLMRFGMIVHILLIIFFYPWALYLALGFPFVFLAVEIFETRLPKSISKPLSRLVLKC